jgi:lactose/cellobiose-specific phosphotransferase system IIC component
MNFISHTNVLKVVDSLRESFIAVIPFVILTSLLILISTLFSLSQSDINVGKLQELPTKISQFFSFILLISISYHLARNFKEDAIVTMLLSIATFISVSFTVFDNQEDSLFFSSGNAQILSILCPIVCVLMLKSCSNLLNTQHNFTGMANQVGRTVNYIIPFIVSFCFANLLLIVVINATRYLISDIGSVIFIESADFFLFFRSLVVHLTWFLGIHGSTLFDTLFGSDMLNSDIFPLLTYRSFYETFGFFGGAGSGLSLIIAILLYSKDGHARRIAIAALPFVIFNINEVLIFGLPIILNRHLLIPFVLAPLISTASAYAFLSFGYIEFSGQVSPWITPIFINAFVVADGCWAAILLQASCLALTTAIYIPFVKKYSSIQSSPEQLRKLEHNLDIHTSLTTKQGFQFNKAQKAIMQSHDELESIICMLSKNHLTVHYQPKMDIIEQHCNQVEALLRVEFDDGKVLGPYFLDHIEQAGLALIIDKWVCQQVKKDIEYWKTLNHSPKVSVNLHPDTLQDTDTIIEICNLLAGYSIEIEIIERAFVGNEQAIENINYLKSHGFKIALDDFGTGFSSLHSLCTVPIDTVKVDKSIVDMIHQEKGFFLNNNITTLCKELQFECVAEGVESIEQLNLIKKTGAKYVQGWLFSKALTTKQVVNFIQNSPDLMLNLQGTHSCNLTSKKLTTPIVTS